MGQKLRYTFSHSFVDGRGKKILVWYSGRIPGDSRVEQVMVSADFFWGRRC